MGYGPDGKRIRKVVSGKTKQEVKDKLKALHKDLARPVRSSRDYTLRLAVEDWLGEGMTGRSAQTVEKYRNVLRPVLREIGDKALADLVDTPQGRAGRPSKALSLEQAAALLRVSCQKRTVREFPGSPPRPPSLMHAYIVLCMLVGVRTEEARALRWDHVDLDGRPGADPPVPSHVAIWRSVRAHGDTKTEKSRRTLGLPRMAVTALRDHRERQLADRVAAGELWQDRGLVFTTQIGTPLDAANVRRMFKNVCTAAGLGDDWTPRELRTSFVSLMSHRGVSTEEIARLVGHSSTRVTETVYRRELRPVITTGAEVMDQIFDVDRPGA